MTMLAGSPLLAQENLRYGESQKEANPVFLGFGLSINDAGLGFGIELPMLHAFSVFGNAGIGMWGWKLGGGIVYYPKHIPYKSSYSVSYYTASGLKDFKTNLWTEPTGAEEEVDIDLYRAGTVNLVYSYNLKVGKSSKFVFSGGYAIPVTTKPYKLHDDAVVLTESSIQFLELMQPGGVIIGVKYMIGI